MKLTVYLFKESVNNFDDTIKERYLSGPERFRLVSQLGDLPFECRAYIQSEKSNPPKWLDYLKRHFDLPETKNVSNSFIILVKARKRLFAISFGYAYNAIEKTALEPNFGLKTTLNAISPDQLDTVDTRSIDVITKQRRTHLNIGSPLHEFDINTSVELLRYASGKIEDGFAAKLAGADSLQISIDIEINELEELCAGLLTLYNSTQYKKQFEFIDFLKPVAKKTPEFLELEEELAANIAQRNDEKISIALPEIPHPDVTRYKVFSGNKYQYFNELDIASIYSFLNRHKVDNPLEKVKIIGLDIGDTAKTTKYSLCDFIVCEIDKGSFRYVYSLGNWYKVSEGYISEVKNKVEALPDLSTDLDMPPVRFGENEDKYNSRVATMKKWLLLDQKMFTFGNYRNRIEACDLVTPENQMIAVKKMKSSATLSHLFAQASVSARLLKLEPEYQKKLSQEIHAKWGKDIVSSDVTFIYAIQTNKTGPIHECMYFFSLVNLMNHVDNIVAHGYNVALCKIEYEG